MILRSAVLIQYWSVTDRHTMTAYTALSIDVVRSRGKNGSHDVTRPFQGLFVVCQLGLAMVKLYTKYEVCTFTHYKDMKGDKKFKTLVVWGVRGPRGHRQHNHSIEHI